MSTERLAIEGGTPVRVRPFPVWPQADGEEEAALLKVLRGGRWWQFAYGQGVELAEPGAGGGERSEVSRFQEEFAAAHGAAYGVAACNGTASLEIILRALDVGIGDEVIVPPYTFIASASAILQVGAVPVFADVDPGTYNLDPAAAEAAVTPRTRALMVVHFAGQSADVDALGALARRRGLHLVEDAAHAHGAAWRGRPCGALGVAGSFSFQASKNMTAGEGGIITTGDRALAQRCSSYLWAGREPGRPWYEHHRLGSNYRLTEFQGAILRVQLRRLAAQTARRDANGRHLAALLAGPESGVEPMRLDGRASRVAFHLFLFRYRPEAFGGRPRAAFLDALAAEGVPGSGGYVHPLYRNPMFLRRDFWKGGFPCAPPWGPAVDFAAYGARCPAAEAACRDTVWLPQNFLLGERADVEDIAAAIAKIRRAWH